MSQAIKRIALVVLLTLLSACASNEFSATQTLVSGRTLKGTHVYVYSFLDIRDIELGPNLLQQLDTQFATELKKSDVDEQVLRFKDSDVGRYYASTRGGMTIPVRQTIESNLNNEREFATNYRMVIFPSKMTVSGAWRFYDINWELYDARTGSRIWTSVSHGKHLNAIKNDEDPENRAKTIIDGVIAELRNSHLI